jgi:hypothetical protein
LNTEIYPEARTGRAYNIENIEKVFSTGGFLNGPQKQQYMKETVLHMPNLVYIPTGIAGALFPHASYMNMTFLGGFRMMGMPNPGNKQNGTFVADFVGTGVSTRFIKASAGEVAAAEPTTTEATKKAEEASLAAEAVVEETVEQGEPKTAGTRKRRQRKVKKTHRREIFSYY